MIVQMWKGLVVVGHFDACTFNFGHFDQPQLRKNVVILGHLGQPMTHNYVPTETARILRGDFFHLGRTVYQQASNRPRLLCDKIWNVLPIFGRKRREFHDEFMEAESSVYLLGEM